MPLVLFSRQLRDSALLGVWHAAESTALLEKLANLSEPEKLYLNDFRLEKRQREWLATRILLGIMSRGRRLTILPNGKPVLDLNMHVSISHSNELAGVVISPTLIGMDIQGEDPKLLKIEVKFTNEKEFIYLPQGSDRLAYLTIIWSVKEAVFKFFGEHVDFAKDIEVYPFNPDDKIITAAYRGQHGHCVFELENNTYGQMHILTTSKPDLIQDFV